LGGQALVLDVEGTWRELTGASLIKTRSNLTSRVVGYIDVPNHQP